MGYVVGSAIADRYRSLISTPLSRRHAPVAGSSAEVSLNFSTQPRAAAMLLKSDEPTLVLTNLKKVFWPDEGYTKRDLLDYYREVAPVILPYLKDRPQVLHRHVDGHEGKEFFQRISRGQPSWVQTAKMPNKQ